jgi:hypothetical protein
MSENLLRMSVTKAAASPGIEISQEYSDMPFKPGAIRGLAMPMVWI